MARYGIFIDLNTCAGCGACVMACKAKNATPRDVWWCNVASTETGTYPDAKKRVMPFACNHCKNAPCVEACPTGATHQTDEGIVLIDQDVCIGCKKCLEACPYEVRHYIEKDPAETPYWGDDFELTPFEEVATVKRHKVGTMEKCTMCEDRIAEGKEPLCVHTCITQCRIFGDIDDPESDISKAIAEHDAVGYKAELGTEPCLFYAGDLSCF